MRDSAVTTRVLAVDQQQPDQRLIEGAAGVLRAGGLVVFPTETVYGLGADALNADAVARVFRAKGRPADNPLIVHIADERHLLDLADGVPPKGEQLARAFWPGPLTLVLPRTVLVSDLVTGGLPTVAIRMPDHPVAQSLIRHLDAGIVGPSANVSGKPSPTSAQHVMQDLNGRVDVVLDAGPSRIGVESTVVDVTVEPPAILRVGGLARERIEEVIGRVEVTVTEEQRRRSPGTRYRHYAPSARVVIVERGNGERMDTLIREFKSRGKNVACIVHSVQLTQLQSGHLFRFLPTDVAFLARNLYRTFRELDSLDVDVILAEAVEEEGLGAAVMDRLRRAAASQNEE